MKTIRASEIGSFIYCQRAWWLQKVGHTPSNQEEMNTGQVIHAQHGRNIFMTGCLRTVAFGLLLAAIIITTIYLTMWIL
jgi:hypothetical protein